MQNKGRVAGFTLIEMLVVVLIIGILAAIALPQYQQAVAKARWVELITVADALYDAEEEYWLQYRRYTPNFADLSIKFPLKVTQGSRASQLMLNNGGYVALMDFNDSGANWTGEYISAINNKKVPASYIRIPAHTRHEGGNWQKYRGARICSPQSERGKNFCKSLGGREIDDFNKPATGEKKHYLL